MSTLGSMRTAGPTPDAPLTLIEPPPRTLGLRDALGLWGNLGISLLLPVAAVFVVLPGRPLAVTLQQLGDRHGQDSTRGPMVARSWRGAMCGSSEDRAERAADSLPTAGT